jgi:O-antigen/teichoic acid export membrane protein
MKNFVRKQLLKNKNLVLLDQAVFSGTTFLSTAILARQLGVEQFGLFSTLVLGVYFILSLSSALTTQVLQTSLGLFPSKKYIAFVSSLQLIISGLFATLIGIGFQIIKNFNVLGDSLHLSMQTILVLSLVIFFWLNHDFIRKSYLALKRLQKTIVVDCILAVFQLLSILYWVYADALTLNTALYSLLIGYAASTLVAAIVELKSIRLLNLNSDYLKHHLKQGKFLLATAGVQWWSSNLFVVASGTLLGSAMLGAFRLVQTMFGVINVLLQAIENYVLPQFGLALQQDAEKAGSYLSSVSKQLGLIFFSTLAVLFFFSEEAITFFGGSTYAAYSSIVQGMAILYIFIFLGYSIRIPLRALNLNKHFFIGYVLAFAFSLCFFQILLSNFNIYGAIAGLIINQLIMLAYWKYILSKQHYL